MHRFGQIFSAYQRFEKIYGIDMLIWSFTIVGYVDFCGCFNSFLCILCFVWKVGSFLWGFERKEFPGNNDEMRLSSDLQFFGFFGTV